MGLPNSYSLLALCLIGMGTQVLAAERQHKITNQDFFEIANMGQVVLSPDAKMAAWLESRWDKNLDKAQKDIWLVDSKSRQSKRLTFSNESESAISWSPDGQYIYFLSSRGNAEQPAPFNAKPQIYRLSIHGGEAVPVTQETGGVKSYQLSDDGSQLYFLTHKTLTDKDPWAGMRAAHQGPGYAHGSRNTNPLYRLDLNHFRKQLLLDDDKVVWEFSVSHDDNKLARITTEDNELVNLEGWSKVEVFDIKNAGNQVLADKLWREQAPSPYGWLLGLSWAEDNRRLAFRVDFDGHPGRLFISDTSKPEQAPLSVKRQGDMTLSGGDIHWRPGSEEICYRGADHALVRLYCTEINDLEQGDTRTLLQDDTVIGSYSFSHNGKQLAFSHNGLDHFYDLFIANAEKRKAPAKRLTNINPQTDSWLLPQLSIVKWQAADGTQVEGILELPPGYRKADGPLPLVVQIHGGPTAATPFALQHRSYGRATFAANGWALLSPNYRGSTGYGDKFLTDLVGHEHEIEVNDIMAGVDKLIAEGLVDADKLAVMGWSNGGYLTNALIASSDRFKAASSGAGVFDQRLQWMLEDTPGHVVNFMQGLPWEKPEAYTHGSSLTHADRIKTPTLIHIGEKDARVPLGHAQGLYRALKHYLNVPVELITYPGEGHGLSRYKHKQAKMDWDQAWFEHYVLGKPFP